MNLAQPMLYRFKPPGLNETMYVNFVVAAYRFEGLPGPVGSGKRRTWLKEHQGPLAAEDCPYGDPELVGFNEWWASHHFTSDEAAVLEAAKIEFKKEMAQLKLQVREWTLQQD